MFYFAEVETKVPVLKPLALITSALVCCALNLVAQPAPTITTQPASQTNMVGANATFSVSVDGAGPLTYEWQFNGTNFPNNIITTVAGNGISSQEEALGDGTPATTASLYFPHGLAFDSTGDLYIADYQNNRIRKVDVNGIITTVARTDLSLPTDVILDDSSNMYITDSQHNRVVKVDTNGVMTTAAGGGPSYGDGGQATNADLNTPRGVAFDSFGNLYIADTGDESIREVDSNGTITTVAGNGSTSYAGDGGQATNASLNKPEGVAFDSFGNLYIADTGNQRIRKVDSNGIITTVAGNGSASYAGDGGQATNASLDNPISVVVDAFGYLYVADSGNQRIRNVDTNGFISTVAGNGNATYAGDYGAATNASLANPTAAALDAGGNLYVADCNNERIRKVLLYTRKPAFTLLNIGVANAGGYTVVIANPYGSVTSTIATLTVEAPPAINVPPASQSVLTGSDAMFSVGVAGSGPFEYGWYFSNTNLIQSGTNNTLVLSGVSTNNVGNYLVVVSNAYGNVTSTLATLTLLDTVPTILAQPQSQTVSAGSNVTLSVTAFGNPTATYQWQFNGSNFPNNIITTVAGNGNQTYGGDNGPATNASLYYPQGVGFDAAGNLYIADNNNDRVRKVDASGIITTVAGNGVGASNNSSGLFAGDGGPATNASLYRPNNLTFDATGNMFIADIFNQRIRKVSTNGFITTVAGNGSESYNGDGIAATNASLYYPASVAFDTAGNYYITDHQNHRIRKVSTNGIITTVAGNGSATYAGDGGPATNASLSYPQSATLDAVGNLYIADSSNQRIRKVGTNGIISTVAGNGTFGYLGDGGAATNANLAEPWFVALDALGNLYIADRYSNRIRKVDSNGIITTVAGNGNYSDPEYSGDGGAATNASLDGPACVALDVAGNLYIADWYNNRIREVHFAGYPTFTLINVNPADAGNYTVVITSAYGSVTSAVATLTVTIPSSPPQIITSDGSFGFQTNQFGFNVGGAFDQTIIVDGSTDLVNWIPLFTNTSTGSPFYFFDSASTNYPWRFYRARLP